jgi:hypothetical protein
MDVKPLKVYELSQASSAFYQTYFHEILIKQFWPMFQVFKSKLWWRFLHAIKQLTELKNATGVYKIEIVLKAFRETGYILMDDVF